VQLKQSTFRDSKEQTALNSGQESSGVYDTSSKKCDAKQRERERPEQVTEEDPVRRVGEGGER